MMIQSRMKYRNILVASLLMSVIFLVSPAPVKADSWPPGTYMGYAELGEDMDNNPYTDSGFFTSSGQSDWYYWEDDRFNWIHVSHYMGIYVEVDSTLDVVIQVVRNEWWYEYNWAIVENEGDEGYDEYFGSYQFTNYAPDQPGWDSVYIAINIYCNGGNGEYELTVYITDS